MEINKGDLVTFKSLGAILNEETVEDINLNGTVVITFKSNVVVKEMLSYFNEGRYKVEEVSTECIVVDNYIFNKSWVAEATHKGSIWEFNEEDDLFVLYNDGVSLCLNAENYEEQTYLQGNICSNFEELLFIGNQRKTEFQIRKFMEQNNTTDEKYMYEIYYSIKDDSFQTVRQIENICSKWAFSSEELAQKCLDLIGKANWKKYVLEIGHTVQK